MQLTLHLNEEQTNYFAACSRIRGIAPTALFRRLASVINKDQLVGAILDDADQMNGRRNGEHRYSDIRVPA